MTEVPLFAAYIEIQEDDVIGKNIECSEIHAPFLTAILENAGFTCEQPHVMIQGTKSISSWVQFLIRGQTFADVCTTILKGLSAAQVQVKEEKFSGLGQEHVRVYLANISVFDKD